MGARARVAVGDARSGIRFRIDPRDVPPAKAARRLHLTLSEFERALPELRRRGFPQPDETTGNYDLAAIDDWMDCRSGRREAGLVKRLEPENAALNFEGRLRALREQGRR